MTRIMVLLFFYCLSITFASNGQKQCDKNKNVLENKKNGIQYNHNNQIVYGPRMGKYNYLYRCPGLKLNVKQDSEVHTILFYSFDKNNMIDVYNPGYTTTFIHSLPQSIHTNAAKTNGDFGMYGTYIGGSGLIAKDLNNDGIVEVLCDGSHSFWYVLSYFSDIKEYKISWMSPYYSTHISCLSTMNVEKNDTTFIVIGLENGTFEIYNGMTLTLDTSINTEANRINTMVVGDGDNDGISELIIGDGQKTYLMDIYNFTVKQTINYGAFDFDLGNVDNDSALELIYTSGLIIKNDKGTITEKWNYVKGFGSKIELSDIDRDGKEEIICASSWYYINAFDCDIQSQKWQIQTDHDIDALLVFDIDNDSIDDIIYADGQWGNINCYDAQKLEKKWFIPNKNHGVTNITIADGDKDNTLEIFWGSGASSSGPDYIHCYEIPSLAHTWSSKHINISSCASDSGDIDFDGEHEIVSVSHAHNSGYYEGIIQIIDAQKKTLKWQSSSRYFSNKSLTGIFVVKIGDVDDDGEKEIIVGTDKLYHGIIYVINGKNYEIEQIIQLDEETPLYAMEIMDIDNDFKTEIIANGGKVHTGRSGVYTYILDGFTGKVKLKSDNLSESWKDTYTMEIKDIDGDGIQEILSLCDNLIIIDGKTHQLWKSDFNGCLGITWIDSKSKGIKNILVGTESGKLICFNGKNYKIIWEYQ